MNKIDYTKEQMKNYLSNLKLVGSISALFSDSDIPMLYYRATENLYCSSFEAQNLSRSDVSADAKLGNIGIGIKTFLENNKHTYQKVAEFNNEQYLYKDLSPVDKIKKIAELRNRRITFTMNAFDIDRMIYHCIVRNSKGLHLFEEDMDLIDLEKIEITEISNSSISFTDKRNNYKFNISKSTLYKQFITEDYFESVDVEVAENPMDLLNRMVPPESDYERLVLPLYSIKNGLRIVPEKSGINQWNAEGRKRDPNEVYIPFPSALRKKFSNFFPPRDTTFEVELPDNNVISMKICQDEGKAIMSNPNKALGEWLLREALNIKELELVTYDMLTEIGIDCVSFEKHGDKYKMDFKKAGTYEEFINHVFEE